MIPLLKRVAPILLAVMWVSTGLLARSRAVTVPVGTEVQVRLQNSLSSETTKVEDRFAATSVEPVRVGGEMAIPAGTVFRGVVSGVKKAGHLDRKSSLTLSFDSVTLKGKRQTIHGTVVGVIESGGYKKDAGKIGIGAGAGAVIGGLLGGGKGVVAGLLIGSGGTLAATTGKNVEVPAGSVLRMRLDQPITTQP